MSGNLYDFKDSEEYIKLKSLREKQGKIHDFSGRLYDWELDRRHLDALQRQRLCSEPQIYRPGAPGFAERVPPGYDAQGRPL